MENQIKAKDKINKSDINSQQKYSLKYPSKSQLRKYHQDEVKSMKNAIKVTEKKLAEQRQELESM